MEPDEIGRYQIRETLGRGGQATAYAAYDPRFDRQVAIKVLAGEQPGDETSRARFLLEARAIASLEHPAIVPVYDFGSEDGRLYLVMRLMGGGTLEDRLEHETFSLAQTIEILDRVAQALDAAHRAGFIHRDVKPANILFDAHGNAHLGDFGIAKLARSASALTSAGMSVGSPAYMSPEQARGDAELTPASDVYSLGVVAYRMLAGKLPFDSPDPFAVMRMHIQDTPQLPPDLHPAVAGALRRVLAKEPPRYAAAPAFVEALREGASGQYRGPTRSIRPLAAGRRRRWLAGGAGLAAAAIATAGGVLAFGGGGSPEDGAAASPSATAESAAPTPGATVVSAFRLLAGDCISFLDSGSAHEVALADCHLEHEFDVVALFTVEEDGAYPGEAAFQGEASERCPPNTTTYLSPSAETWAEGGRGVVCLQAAEEHNDRLGTIVAPPGLNLGDCFLDRSGGLTELEIVACNHGFDFRVIELFLVDDAATFPGDAALEARADERCPPNTETYLSPSEATWAAGDREIICLRGG